MRRLGSAALVWAVLGVKASSHVQVTITSNRDDGGVGQLRAELAVHGDLVQLRLAAHAGVVRVQEVRRAHLEAVEAPVRDLRLQPLRGNPALRKPPRSRLCSRCCWT